MIIPIKRRVSKMTMVINRIRILVISSRAMVPSICEWPPLGDGMYNLFIVMSHQNKPLWHDMYKYYGFCIFI